MHEWMKSTMLGRICRRYDAIWRVDNVLSTMTRRQCYFESFDHSEIFILWYFNTFCNLYTKLFFLIETKLETFCTQQFVEIFFWINRTVSKLFWESSLIDCLEKCGILVIPSDHTKFKTFLGLAAISTIIMLRELLKFLISI